MTEGGVEVPPTTKSGKEPKPFWRWKNQAWLVLLNGLNLIATIVAASFFYAQMEAAQEANRLATSNFHQSERPWVEIVSPQIHPDAGGTSADLSITVKNAGKTLARKISATTGVAFSRSESVPNDDASERYLRKALGNADADAFSNDPDEINAHPDGPSKVFHESPLNMDHGLIGREFIGLLLPDASTDTSPLHVILPNAGEKLIIYAHVIYLDETDAVKDTYYCAYIAGVRSSKFRACTSLNGGS